MGGHCDNVILPAPPTTHGSEFKMLSQKLSRINLKLSDLQEYEEVKKKRKESEEQNCTPGNIQKSGTTSDTTTKKTPRKALMFDTAGTTPARSSTPDD